MKQLSVWIGKALSENGEPSSKRLIAFMLAVVVCFGTLFAIVSGMKERFEQYLFYGLLATILLLLGVATIPQLVQLWKGGGAPVTPKEEEKV